METLVLAGVVEFMVAAEMLDLRREVTWLFFEGLCERDRMMAESVG